MRSLTFFLILIFSFQGVYSQWVTVKSIESTFPIPNAILSSTDTSIKVRTDQAGRADISMFPVDSLLLIKHPLYLPLSIFLKDIKASSGVVFLETDENQLSEVVISVSKWEQDQKKIPQKVVHITEEDVLMNIPQTTADLLQRSGQVYVQKSQLGGGSPMIRGFSTNRLLLTVDGVRMNTAIFRGGNVQNVIAIDPFAIGQSEVVLGPGSVVYGSDAIGGVMNFYTKKPQFSKQNSEVNGHSVFRYSSANQEKTAHADVTIGFDHWAFLTSVSYSDFEDLTMGSDGPDSYLRNEYASTIEGVDVTLSNDSPRDQIPTGYSQVSFMQKIRYKPNTTWDFDMGLLYSTTSNFSRYDRLLRYNDGVLRSAEWFYGPQRWVMGTMQVTQKSRNDFYDSMKITTAYQFFEESRNDRDYGSSLLSSTVENVDAYSLNLDFEKKVGASGALFYGAEYVMNHVHSEGQQTDITTREVLDAPSRYPDGSGWQSLAAYLSYQHHFNSKFSMQSGLRYNHILLDAAFDSAFFDFPFTEAKIDTGAFTANTGWSWLPMDALQWKLNFATSFRAPNIDDIGKIFDSEPGAVVVPNPDLKPEYAYTGELGLQWKPVKKLVFDLATYYTFLDDALIRRDFTLNGEDTILYDGELSQVQAIQNASKSSIYGFEVGMQFDFGTFFKLTSQYTITKGFDEEDGGIRLPSRHVSPQFGNTHLTFNSKKLVLDAYMEYNGSLSFDQLAPSEQAKPYLYASDVAGNPYSPSWYTLNFKTRYEFSTHLQTIVALENITNQRYRTYSSGLAGPGCNLVVTLKYSL